MMPNSKLAWLTELLECQSDIFDGSDTGFNYKGQKYSFKRHNRIIYYNICTQDRSSCYSQKHLWDDSNKSGACLYY